MVGFVFVFLAVGMGTVHLSLGLYNLVAERLVARRRTAMFLGLVPIGAIWLLAELLIITESASFTGSLGIVGALTGPLMGGVFPILMMESSRRRRGATMSRRCSGGGSATDRRRARLPRLHGHRGDLCSALPSAVQRLVAATVVVLVLVVTVAMPVRGDALAP